MALVAPTMGATQYSSFWNLLPGGLSAPNYSPRYFRSNNERVAAQKIAGSHGFRKWRGVMRALNGVAAGGSTADTPKRTTAVVAYNDPQHEGGLRTMQTVTNTLVTTAGMQTAINNLFYDNLFTKHPSTYPADLSGNGGGGKAGR